MTYKVAVIGCGAIGIITALEIQKVLKNNVSVTIFTKEISPNTTSDIAAGLWGPCLLNSTPSNKINTWARITQTRFLEIWKNGEALQAGISLQPILTLSSEEDNFELIPSWLEYSLSYKILTKNEINKLKKCYNCDDAKSGYFYTSFIWEPSKFLPYLMNNFKQNGGIIMIEEITNFESKNLKQFDAIVNCTGINSKDLAHDEKVYAIKGQVCRVEAPWIFHTLIIDIQPTKCYLIPNQNCIILGGTKENFNYDTSPKKKDELKIIENCKKILPALQDVNILRSQAGLRPARNQVRLEIDKLNNKIVHNYGHGGSGITLSIGCAVEAAELVKRSLTINSTKPKL